MTQNAIWKTSPNFTVGRGGTAVDRIVIHYIVGNLAACDSTFLNPASQVSAHYGIGEGRIHQYVSMRNTAWHSGNWAFNQRSIGIEHSASPDRAPSTQTLNMSIERCVRLCQQFNLNPRTAIVPHESVVPTACPGTVDWEYIRARTAARL